MKFSITLSAALLALAAFATSCTTLGETAGGGVYLVGVAGGG